MSNDKQARQPSGAPESEGGQFAETNRPEASTQLEQPAPSFQGDVQQLADQQGWSEAAVGELAFEYLLNAGTPNDQLQFLAWLRGAQDVENAPDPDAPRYAAADLWVQALAGSKVLAGAELRTQGNGAIALHLATTAYSPVARGMHKVGVLLSGDGAPELWSGGTRLAGLQEHIAWSEVAAGTDLPISDVKAEVGRVLRVVTWQQRNART